MRKQRKDKKDPFFAKFRVGEKINKRKKWGDVEDVGEVVEVWKDHLVVVFSGKTFDLKRTQLGQISQNYDKIYNYERVVNDD